MTHMADSSASRQRLLARLTLVGLAAVWLGAIELVINTLLVGAIAIALASALVIGWTFFGRHQVTSRLALRIGMILILISTIGALVFLPHGALIQLLCWGSAALVFIYGQQATEPTPTLLQGRLTTFAMVVVIWLILLASLSWAVYINGQWWEVGLVGLVTVPLVATVICLELGVAGRQIRSIIPWLAGLGAELFIATWWLPTAVIVGATVTTVVVTLFIHAVRHVWVGNWQPARARRYLIIGLAIVSLVLLTARYI
jgi:hypothetical protein